MLPLLVLILLLAVAAANGANDVSKGIATLAGSGVTRYRTAILWGTLTTLAGALLSGLFAERMLKLFTKGIFSGPPTPKFTLAVICGTVGWVTLATVKKWPVSTTHAIIGSLIGAGASYAPASVAWSGIVPRLALPLLLSIALSYALSATLNRIFGAHAGSEAECLCAGVESLDTGLVQLPQLSVLRGSTQECSNVYGYLRFSPEWFHWLSSGAVGFARGLNDAPKLAALGAGLLGAHLGLFPLLVLVALAMCAGSLYAGRRVAHVLAEKLVRMNHKEGLLANLATAMLVGVGANFGLPMSTTHVSTAAISGIAGVNPERLNRRTVLDLVKAWTITPLAAGLFAAGSHLIGSRLLVEAEIVALGIHVG